ncbi:hypothetical protein C8J57DRAFT_1232963 [Mycena rebaudengoi]|nr:hypothetical protein C8J57DRAFT_1232963 [Mycena rebaudengoi]
MCAHCLIVAHFATRLLAGVQTIEQVDDLVQSLQDLHQRNMEDSRREQILDLPVISHKGCPRTTRLTNAREGRARGGGSSGINSARPQAQVHDEDSSQPAAPPPKKSRSGKTVIFSAEATSEHIKRPFYVIGGGGLGTKAVDLDAALERVFDIATAWTAIVLIDKRRSGSLTTSSATPWQPSSSATSSTTATSRVQAFDKAFLSRIHVTLHFRELSEPSKAQVWRAFLAKAGAAEVSAAHISLLAQRDVNGHQVKNAMSTHPPSPTRFGSDQCLLSTQVRTAHSLAVRREERIGMTLDKESHLLESHFPNANIKEKQRLRALRRGGTGPDIASLRMRNPTYWDRASQLSSAAAHETISSTDLPRFQNRTKARHHHFTSELLPTVAHSGLALLPSILLFLWPGLVVGLASTLQQVTDFGINPTNVGMFIYIPTSVTANPAVIVAIHDCNGTAQTYFAFSPYPQFADTYGFIVIYPSSPNVDTCWDVTSPATLTHGGGSDSQGIASMVDYAISTYSADPTCISVAGTASGGTMTSILMATYAELWRTATIYSGAAAGCFVNTSTVLGSYCTVDDDPKIRIIGLRSYGRCTLVIMAPTHRSGCGTAAKPRSGPAMPSGRSWSGAAY